MDQGERAHLLRLQRSCKNRQGGILIAAYTVTDSSVHDSQEVYADSAYVGPRMKKILERRNIQNRIHENGYRYLPLTMRQMQSNRKESSICARVEHVFGHITNSMNGLCIRSIGIVRARATVGKISLTHNIMRFIQLQMM
jgi:IS5 family transposase